MPPIKPKKPTLADKLATVKPKPPRGPLWEGPSGKGWNGGVTQSLIKSWLSCRERFRIKYVEGWRANEKFNPRMDYGSMWRSCEERFAAGRGWESALLAHAQGLIRKYPFQGDEIRHWHQVCKTQFPLYTKWWSEHPEVVERTPLLQEYAFDVPYQLPSGRIVRLRGKFDGVDLIGNVNKTRGRDHGTGAEAGIYLFETKTKGDIDEIEIQRNLTWDIQTMTYLVALESVHHEFAQDVPEGEWCFPIKGVRYNVVRRPLSGGKGSIKQGKGKAGAKCSKCDATGSFTDKKTQVTTTCPKCEGARRIGAEPPETDAAFFARLGKVIEGAVGQEWEVGADENYFFRRWKAEIRPGDVDRFRRECLDPILEQMCDWYECVTGCSSDDPFQRCKKHGSVHWRHPFGAANAIDEYGHTDIDEYVNHGSTIGLVRSEELFSELKS